MIPPPPGPPPISFGAPAGPAPGPFDSTQELILNSSTESPTLGSLSICDPSGTELARFRREGQGWQALQVNMVLEHPDGLPICFLRIPPSTARIRFGVPFVLSDPTGAAQGEIGVHTGWSPYVYLRHGETEILTARPVRGRKPYPVLRGSDPMATVAYEGLAFSVGIGPVSVGRREGNIHLRFGFPPSTPPPRYQIVAFVSHLVMGMGSQR